jgi:hypothetical protein
MADMRENLRELNVVRTLILLASPTGFEPVLPP